MLEFSVVGGLYKKHKNGDIFSRSHIVVVIAQQTIWRLIYQLSSYKHRAYQAYLVNL